MSTSSAARLILVTPAVLLAGCFYMFRHPIAIEHVDSQTIRTFQAALKDHGCNVEMDRGGGTYVGDDVLHVGCHGNFFRIDIAKAPRHSSSKYQLYYKECDARCERLLNRIVAEVASSEQKKLGTFADAPVTEDDKTSLVPALGDFTDVESVEEAPRPAIVPRSSPVARKGDSVGLPIVEAPVPGDPLHCFSPGDDVYCLMRYRTIVALSNRVDVMTFPSEDGFLLSDVICDVARGGQAACLVEEDRTEGSDSQRRTTVRLSLHAEGRVRRLEQGTSQDGFYVHADGIHLDDGGVTYAWTVKRRSGGDRDTRSYIAHGAQKTERFEVELPSRSWAAALASIGEYRYGPRYKLFRVRGELWIMARDGDALVAAHVVPSSRSDVQELEWHRVANSSRHDFRVVSANDGWIYAFHFDPGDDSAMVSMSQNGSSWSRLRLDTAESGWQMEAAKSGSGAIAAWYYRRSTYNKGLRSAELQDGRIVKEARTIVRNEERNVGWLPVFGVTEAGETWASWIDDHTDDKRVWAHCSSRSELELSVIPDRNEPIERTKDWYLQLGGGAWFAWWHIGELGVDEDGTSVGSATYSLDPALLLSASFEARLGPVQLALGVAQSIMDKADRASDGSLTSLIGAAQFDDLFLGHDIQVRATYGHYRGRARPPAMGDLDDVGTLSVDTDYLELQALALNKWRIKYGISYAAYKLPATVHAFIAQEGERSYSYSGSYFREVEFHDVRFVIGYSTLDYVARYENKYSKLIVDGDFMLGASFMDFAGVPAGPAASVGDGTGLWIGGHLDIGWLWLMRSRAASGLGFYVRPVYRGELSVIAGGGKPSDRKAEDADTTSTNAGASLASYRHGPWLDVGVIW